VGRIAATRARLIDRRIRRLRAAAPFISRNRELPRPTWSGVQCVVISCTEDTSRASRYCPPDIPTKTQSRGLTRCLQSARDRSTALRFGTVLASSSGVAPPRRSGPMRRLRQRGMTDPARKATGRSQADASALQVTCEIGGRASGKVTGQGRLATCPVARFGSPRRAFSFAGKAASARPNASATPMTPASNVRRP
jgi:hypothetical protein